MYSHDIDHVVAIKHGGQTTEDNLVLACLPCNRHKGSDLTSIDPITGKITLLFNPRRHDWEDHFQLQGGTIIIGRTEIGRTSTFLFRFNAPNRLRLRQALAAQNLYPNLS